MRTGQPKLTGEKIGQVKELLKQRVPMKLIASYLGVSPPTIRAVKQGKGAYKEIK